MKRAIQIICFLLLLGCFTGGLQATGETGFQLVSKTGTAVINWTDGVLNAVGSGTPPEAYFGDERGREVALTAAIEDARRKLMSAVKGIVIDAGGSVGDLIENSSIVQEAVKEMVDSAEVVQQEFTTDGSVEVTVQMSMNGGFSQLVLPEVIRQIESVKPISTSPGFGAEEDIVDVSTFTEIVTGPYTGMIVDGRGIGITPCMVPRVCDENGQEVFGPAYASREFAVQNGMIGYVSDMDAAARHPRVADRPLILKGLRTGGTGNCDVVVSNVDAARLRSAFENLALLRQCRVMIVMDMPNTSGEG
jgi:hypothetical protein